MTHKKMPPVHPGVILFEEFLKPMDISQYRLAHDINVPPRRINEIVHGREIKILPNYVENINKNLQMIDNNDR